MGTIYWIGVCVLCLGAGGFGGSRYGAARAGGATVGRSLWAVISGGGGPTPPK